jgi:hypothetical protein
MRAAELLAIVAICPLGMFASGCPRIEQPIGQYRATTTRPQGATGPANSASSSAQGEQNRSAFMDASAGADSSPDESPANRSRLPPPVFPNDLSPDAQPTATGATWTPTMLPRECYKRSDPAIRKQLDMYIVMDANVTLPYSGAWEVATTGVRNFVQDPAAEGTGVGLRYYGSERECDPKPYNEEPTVEVGELPANEEKLVAATLMQADYAASPMAFALEGGIMHQKARAKAYPDRKQIVVLVTDGFTQDLACRYSLQEVQDIASEGYATKPQIETYVIGFGSPDTMSQIADDILSRFSVLNSIARDGGGGRAASVKFNDDPQIMYEALTAIRRAAQPCVYEVPANADPANLNLSVFPGSFVPRVDGREACKLTEHGFYYMPEGSDAPTSIELCLSTCLVLQSNDFAGVLFQGCPTVRPED